MPNVVHLERAQVPSHLRADYTGRKFQAVVTETVNIPAGAGRWDGGSRDSYRVIRLADGTAVSANQPMSSAHADVTVTLEPGFAVVRHSTIQGMDTGLTFFVHPTNVTQLIPPAAPDLTAHDQLVLSATVRLKASHGGLDRYELAAREHETAPSAFPSRADWDAAKQHLQQLGLLDKRGAITAAGRNAARR